MTDIEPVRTDNLREQIIKLLSDLVAEDSTPQHYMAKRHIAAKILNLFGKWLGDSLSRDAANIYLLVQALKKEEKG